MNTKKIPPLTLTLSLNVLVVLVLAVLYAYFFISLDRMGDEQLGKAIEIKDAGRILDEEGRNKEELSKYVLSEGGQAKFVSSLESRCNSYGLACTVVSLNEAEEIPGSIKSLSISLSAEGSLESVNKLLSYFETAPYPIIVSRTLFSATAGGWEGVFEISLPVMLN